MYSHIGKTLYFVEINICIQDNNYISITKYMKRLHNVYNSNFFLFFGYDINIIYISVENKGL